MLSTIDWVNQSVAYVDADLAIALRDALAEPVADEYTFAKGYQAGLDDMKHEQSLATDALIAKAIEAHDEAMAYANTVNMRKHAQKYLDELIPEAIAKEREECAILSEDFDRKHPDTNYGRCIAVAIRARGKAGLKNLHFHDSRSQAIFNLSKKLDVLELARVVGHRDIRSLMIYYQTSAESLADKL